MPAMAPRANVQPLPGIFCQSCGSSNKSGAAFCTKCGTPLSESYPSGGGPIAQSRTADSIHSDFKCKRGPGGNSVVLLVRSGSHLRRQDR
jgi:hypothetical protein